MPYLKQTLSSLKQTLSSRRSISAIVSLIVLLTIAIAVRQLSGGTAPASGTSARPQTALAARQGIPDSIDALGTVEKIDGLSIPRIQGLPSEKMTIDSCGGVFQTVV